MYNKDELEELKDKPIHIICGQKGYGKTYYETNKLIKEREFYKKALDTIDLIIYRLRFVDVSCYDLEDFSQMMINVLNDIRQICQHPESVEQILKGSDNNE